jgi:hypothetical protein
VALAKRGSSLPILSFLSSNHHSSFLITHFGPYRAINDHRTWFTYRLGFYATLFARIGLPSHQFLPRSPRTVDRKVQRRLLTTLRLAPANAGERSPVSLGSRAMILVEGFRIIGPSRDTTLKFSVSPRSSPVKKPAL